MIFFPLPSKFRKVDCLLWTERNAGHTLATLMKKHWFALFQIDIMTGADLGAQTTGNTVIPNRKVFVV